MQRTQSKMQSNQRRPDKSAVLAKALKNASKNWGMNQTEMGKIIGKKQSAVSEIYKGNIKLNPASKDGEIALLFLRAYRSLDTLMGGDSQNCKAWLAAHNHALNGAPLELMQKLDGLNSVNRYLDAMRGKA